MMNGHPESDKGPGNGARVLGYLAGDLAGIAAGIGVGILLQDLLNVVLLSVVGGLLAALLVAGAILFLVWHLTGAQKEDGLDFFGRQVQEKAAVAGPVQEGNVMYVGNLKTNRGLVKYILLSLITCGIYDIVVMSSIGNDINQIAKRYDGKKTMHFCLIYFLLTGLTLGIAPLVWYHRISARIGNELKRRCISYKFGAGSFWGWNLLGSLIVIGPLVYMHKLFKAMNLLCADYNVNL